MASRWFFSASAGVFGFFFFLFAFFSSFLDAEENLDAEEKAVSTGSIFFQAGPHCYLFPADPFSLIFSAESPGRFFLPGFRLGGGGALSIGPNLSFSVETGLSFIPGETPGDFRLLIPLNVLIQYAVSLSDRFSLNPGMAIGAMILGGTSETDCGFFFGPRFYGEYRFAKPDARSVLSLYAGIGADFLLGKKGAAVMPAAELGVRFRIQNQAPEKPPEKKPPPEKTAPAQPEPAPEKLPEKKPLALVYFEENSAEPLERYRRAISAAALYLTQHPEDALILRGYADPAERKDAAEERSRYCADILIRQYGIAENRLRLEYADPQELPYQAEKENPLSRRAVEFLKF
ncbi:MAG: hypothetical protein LBG87_01660 [Spirochaetaceae bacterium]|jgi:outer membrane protein OmpA-like peptidoglycan-associated protein|nr:hypothetical protein [Spirochaetaceae bacterium]